MPIKSEWRNVVWLGSETLSRVVDNHDRDSMIYSDGAASIETSDDEETGFYESGTYAMDEANYLFFGKSYNQIEPRYSYIMHGRKIYEFALTTVPPR
jgi:3-oxoacyl-[acyl-carrier-protein] synthase-3